MVHSDIYNQVSKNRHSPLWFNPHYITEDVEASYKPRPRLVTSRYEAAQAAMNYEAQAARL